MTNPLKKLILTAGVCIAGAISPLAASAQTTPNTPTTAISPADDVRVGYGRREHHNYGWIGLVGLLGLAGLMGRNRDNRVVDRTDVRRTNT